MLIATGDAERPAAIDVFDAAGRHVLRTTAIGWADVDLAGQASGVYFVRIAVAGQVQVARVVKQ